MPSDSNPISFGRAGGQARSIEDTVTTSLSVSGDAPDGSTFWSGAHCNSYYYITIAPFQGTLQQPTSVTRGGTCPVNIPGTTQP